MLTLLQRMEIARARIDALYEEGPHKAQFLAMSAQAYGYYAGLLEKSQFRQKKIVENYELLAYKLSKVKESPLDSAPIVHEIEHLTLRKKLAIVFGTMINLLKIGVLIGITLFLLKFSLVSAIIALAIYAVPVIPKIAFVLALCSAYLGYLGFKEGWSSLFDFKGFSHAREESTMKKNLCLFFQPAKAPEEPSVLQMQDFEAGGDPALMGL